MLKWVIPARIAGIVIRLQAGKYGVLITAGERNFLYSRVSRPALGLIQPSSYSLETGVKRPGRDDDCSPPSSAQVNPYPTAFPYGNGMVLHFYQQQESSTTKTVHKVINKGLKAYV